MPNIEMKFKIFLFKKLMPKIDIKVEKFEIWNEV